MSACVLQPSVHVVFTHSRLDTLAAEVLQRCCGQTRWMQLAFSSCDSFGGLLMCGVWWSHNITVFETLLTALGQNSWSSNKQQLNLLLACNSQDSAHSSGREALAFSIMRPACMHMLCNPSGWGMTLFPPSFWHDCNYRGACTCSQLAVHMVTYWMQQTATAALYVL